MEASGCGQASLERVVEQKDGVAHCSHLCQVRGLQRCLAYGSQGLSVGDMGGLPGGPEQTGDAADRDSSSVLAQLPVDEDSHILFLLKREETVIVQRSDFNRITCS